MTTARNRIVAWNPHVEDIFAVGSLDIQFFQVTDDGDAADFKQIDSLHLGLDRPLTSVRWGVDSSNKHLLAAGLRSGHVVIVNGPPQRRVVLDLPQEHKRSCNAVEWNPSKPSLLAVGLAQRKNAPSLLLYDVSTATSVAALSPTDSTPVSQSTVGPVSSAVSNSRQELHLNASLSQHTPTVLAANGNMCGVISLAWMPGSEHVLAAGTNRQFLRFYDVRESHSKPISSLSAARLTVSGVSFDPFADYRMMTWCVDDGLIRFWDLRYTREAVVSVAQNTKKELLQVEWSATRPYTMAAICKDDIYLRLWDLRSTLTHYFEPLKSDPHFTPQYGPTEVLRLPFRAKINSSGVSSFAWHGTRKDRLLTVTSKGVVQHVKLSAAIPISVSSSDCVAWAGYNEVRLADIPPPTPTSLGPQDNEQKAASHPDLRSPVVHTRADRMRQCAKAGYGMEVRRNMQVARVHGDQQLFDLWLWFAQCTDLAAGSQLQKPVETVRAPVRRRGRHAHLVHNKRAQARTATARGPSFLSVSGLLVSPKNIGQLVENSTVTSLAALATNPNRAALCPALLDVPIYKSASRTKTLRLCGWWPLTAAASSSPNSSSANSAHPDDDLQPWPYVPVHRSFSLPSTLKPGPLYRSSGVLTCAVTSAHSDPHGVRLPPHAGVLQDPATQTQPTPTSASAPSGSSAARAAASSGSPTDKAKESKQEELAAVSASVGLERTLLMLEREGCYERAAAIALFHLQIRRAIQSLRLGAERRRAARSSQPGQHDDLTVVAVALSGYAASGNNQAKEQQSLWAETCAALHSQVHHPYLKAIFTWLGGPLDQTVGLVLKRERLMLTDSIALAIRFLPDRKLAHFLKTTTELSIKQGDLNGLVLTGLGEKGIGLLQAYVDLTADLQNVAVLGSYIVIGMLKTHSRGLPLVLHQWIQSYRDLLDRWLLFTVRAAWDIQRSALLPPAAYAKAFQTELPEERAQAVVRCSYCASPLALDKMQLSTRGAGTSTQSSARLRYCQKCSHSLPKCTLCSKAFTITTPLAARIALDKQNRSGSVPSALDASTAYRFQDWFTWCQQCRHGGHASHMRQWFASHKECPVTQCNCACASLDPV